MTTQTDTTTTTTTQTATVVPTPSPTPQAPTPTPPVFNAAPTPQPATGSVVNSSTVTTNTPSNQSPVAAANTQNTMTTSIATRLQQNLSVSDFAILITDISQYGTQSQKYLVSVMTTYLNNMAPGKLISPTNGILQQYNLFNQMQIILQNIPSGEFVGAWSLLLRYYYQNSKGALSPSKANRFIYLWKQSSGNKDLFVNLNNLLEKTSDVTTMLTVTKSISFNKLFSIITPIAKSRLASYYKIQA